MDGSGTGGTDGLRLARWRMYAQRLVGPPFATPAEAVRRLGAVQSQEYGPALWSLGMRVDRSAPGTTGPAVAEPDVDGAFADGAFLRTHVLRPTWHFVAPQDIRWLLTATAHRVHALNAPYYRSLGLDDATLAKTGDLITGALRGGNHLTRAELQAVLAGAGLEASGMRLGYLLMHAELTAAICSGPRRGRQQTYALLAERAPDARDLSPDEALAELTRRYFTGHGPATARDLQWWASLTRAEVRRGLEMAGPDLRREEIGGVEFWYGEPEPGAGPGNAPEAHLLQAYDEYVSYGESRGALDVAGHARVAIGRVERPLYNHLVVLDSQVAGRWRRTVRRREVLVEAILHRPLDADEEAALRAAADRHGRFLGGLAATVTTQAH